VSVEFELRMVLDRSPDAVVKLDRDMRHVYVNEKAAAAFGLPPDDILGRTNRELGRPEASLPTRRCTTR
jgi:PAS domain S-box-containing protein